MNNSTTSAAFLERFALERDAIQHELDILQNSTSIKQVDVHRISGRISALSAWMGKERAEEFLPAYDRKLCMEQITKLSADLEDVRAKTASRGKFSFKKKTPTGTSTPAPGTPATSTAVSLSPSPPRQPFTLPPPSSTARVVGNLSNRVITAADFLQPGETQLKKTDIILSDLRNCIVLLRQGEIEVSALYARNLDGCIVMGGFVSGSVRLERVVRGSLMIGCHQLRFERCESLAVFCAVQSVVTIEESSMMGFGKYPEATMDVPLGLENSGVSVQDFSSVSSRSKNWKKLGEDDGSAWAGYFLELAKLDSRDWPNDGMLFPPPEEATGVAVKLEMQTEKGI